MFIVTDNGTSETKYSDGTVAIGKDRNITVTTGTVNVEDIYEDDVVSGVTTYRGVDKGLNYGAGNYDPENGAYIDCFNFTIDAGATLTNGTAMGTGAVTYNGIVFIACLNEYINNGAISLASKGYSGGARQVSSGRAGTGLGAGGGQGGERSDTGTKGIGGSAYGSTDIPLTTWSHLYGSGGGGGCRGTGGSPVSYTCSSGAGGGGVSAGTNGVDSFGPLALPIGNPPGNGAVGGGAIRIYARNITTDSGTMTVNGATGLSNYDDVHAHGGGGSGGTIYLESTYASVIGTNQMTSTGGAGGGGDAFRAAGGAGSNGRIHIEGTYTGTTSSPAVA